MMNGWAKFIFGYVYRCKLNIFSNAFFGLQGMPRRYADYPDAYAGWNAIATYGSYISGIAVIWFIVILFRTLYFGKSALIILGEENLILLNGELLLHLHFILMMNCQKWT